MMLLKEAKKYPFDFLLLFLGLLLLVFLFFAYSHLPGFQERVLLAGGGFYFLWGVGHHWLRGDLSLLVALEYFFLGLAVAAGGWLVLSWL